MKKLLVCVLAVSLALCFAPVGHAQHYVTKGETMKEIAKEYKMGLEDLISLNLHIDDPNKIKVGDYIIVRTRTENKKDLTDYARSLQDVTAFNYNVSDFPYETDSPGFIQGIYGKFGLKLPGTSEEQSKTGLPVKFEDLQIGDVMFFSTEQDKAITHIGIYLGNDYWISNLNEKRGVEILSTWGRWAQDNFLWGARYKI